MSSGDASATLTTEGTNDSLDDLTQPEPVGGAADVVLRFVSLLNARDVSGLLLLLAEDAVLEDLSHETAAEGREDVARFYANVVAAMPGRAILVVDDITTGDAARAGLTWHMAVDGTDVPLSRGLAFFSVRSEGSGGRPCISRIVQSPEHWLKLAPLALSASGAASPLVDSLGPMALPDFWASLARGASTMLASAPPVDQLLMNLAAAGRTSHGPGTAAGLGLGGMPGAHSPVVAHSAMQMAAFAGLSGTGTHAAHGRPVVRPSTAAVSSSPKLDMGATSPRGAAVVCTAAVMAPPGTSPSPGGSVQEDIGESTTSSSEDSNDEASNQVAPAAPMGLESLAGVWEKDLTTSEGSSYDAALDLLGLGGMHKATARLIEGLEMAVTPGKSVTVHFLTIIPYFKVTEAYPLGSTGRMRRRDLRSGDASASAEAVSVGDTSGLRSAPTSVAASDIGVGAVCRSRWGAPYAGDLVEVYALAAGAPDTMHVTSTLSVGGRSATTTQVFVRRHGASAKDLLAASEKRNGNATDILKKFR